MGLLRRPDPVALVVAVFSRHPEALAWARGRLEVEFGGVALASPAYEFHQTAYYEPTMGQGLRKQFLLFTGLIDPARLAEIKRRTNDLEDELAPAGVYPEPRPVNLDPGVLALGKFLLATTKDQSHRVYLRDGVFAEVTLRYRDGAFEPWPWTYADYSQPAVLEFFQQARSLYRQLLRQAEKGEKEHGHGQPDAGTSC